MTDAFEEAVVAAVAGCPRPLEVTGVDELADRLRKRLDAAPCEQPGAPRPGTIVETTGLIVEVERALVRVGDLGTVLLVGPPPVDRVALDVHDDLHVRGLTMIGIPRVTP